MTQTRTLKQNIETALINLVPSKRSVIQTLTNNFGIPYFGSATKSGTVINDKSALTLSAVFNGIDLISNDVAKLSKGIFKKNTDSRIRLTNHPLDYILTIKPNQYQTSFLFFKTMVIIAILKGNFYARIIRNSYTNTVKKILILDADKVSVLHHNSKLFYKYNDVVYLSSEIIHIPGFSIDGLIGMPVIKLAAQSLGVSLASQEYSSEYYAAKGVGAGIVTSQKPLDKTAKSRISTAVADVLTSISPWKVPVFDEGMTFQQLKITAEESQFLQTNKYGIEEVARWLNLPPHKLKSLDKATNNNIEHQSLEHVEDSIHPWAVKIEQEFNSKIFTEAEKKDHYLKLNIRSLLRADLKSQAEYYAKAINFGWLTRNEVRGFEEMNPLDGLSEPLTPVNTFTQEQINENLLNNE